MHLVTENETLYLKLNRTLTRTSCFKTASPPYPSTRKKKGKSRQEVGFNPTSCHAYPLVGRIGPYSSCAKGPLPSDQLGKPPDLKRRRDASGPSYPKGSPANFLHHDEHYSCPWIFGCDDAVLCMCAMARSTGATWS